MRRTRRQCSRAPIYVPGSEVATIPTAVNDIAYSDGRWIAVGGVVTGTDELAAEFPNGAVYSSADGRTWASCRHRRHCAGVHVGCVRRRCLGRGRKRDSPGGGTFGRVHQHRRDALDDTRGAALHDQNEGRLAFGSGRVGARRRTDRGAVGRRRQSERRRSTWTTGSALRERIHRWRRVRRRQVHGRRCGRPLAESSTVFVSPDGRTWSKRGHLDGAAFDLAFGGRSGERREPHTDFDDSVRIGHEQSPERRLEEFHVHGSGVPDTREPSP